MKKRLSIIASLSYILSGCSSVETNIKKNDKPKVDPEFIATYSRLSGRAAVCVEFGYPQYKADNIINAGVSGGFYDRDIALSFYNEQMANKAVAQAVCEELKESLDNVAKSSLNWRERNDKAYRADQHAQYYNLSYQCLLPFGNSPFVSHEDVRRYLLNKYGPITDESLDVPMEKDCDDYHSLFPKVGFWVKNNPKKEIYPFLSQQGLESVGKAIDSVIEPKSLQPIRPLNQNITIHQIPGSHVIHVQQ
ncbi:hypothetical protein [Vibrio parahaemolyticus]|uniref:hypothetical protein n=1 Tax=Vibrio parahaemolyticus TaxID=670 RepID=UPI00128FBBF5|nr:hypothetical protein [Vibrio parahaemolyticus]MQC67754.1 hypothetical protein [Vibrio parahaemolyticus]